MGTAHTVIHPEVYDRLCTERFISTVNFINVTNFGDGLLFCLIETNLLPEGYHGQMNVVLDSDTVRFKRDMDT